MNILIVTKNSIIGKGLALELECLGYKAEFSTAFTKGYDIYIADADAFEIESSSNYITFSATEGKADLKRPFTADELLSFIEKSRSEDSGKVYEPPVTGEEFDKSCLSETEAKLLEVLLENRGHPVSPQVLSKRVWGRDSIKSNIVNVYIRYLREKLEKGSANRIIFTVRGQGYKIN